MSNRELSEDNAKDLSGLAPHPGAPYGAAPAFGNVLGLPRKQTHLSAILTHAQLVLIPSCSLLIQMRRSTVEIM
jgi:hypothetical protein